KSLAWSATWRAGAKSTDGTDGTTTGAAGDGGNTALTARPPASTATAPVVKAPTTLAGVIGAAGTSAAPNSPQIFHARANAAFRPSIPFGLMLLSADPVLRAFATRRRSFASATSLQPVSVHSRTAKRSVNTGSSSALAGVGTMPSLRQYASTGGLNV